MKNKTKHTWRLAAMATGMVLGFGAGHLACKQDGSGPDFSGLSKIVQPVASGFGSAAGIDPKITDTAVAVVNYLDRVSVSPADEDGMGQAVAVTLTNTYPLTDDVDLNKYVAMVGLTIANASDRPVGNWQFGVLESEDVNAFAGPNGYIFVTRGALDRMDNEAQLAGVLAHEVTHVLHHHGLHGVRQGATVDFAKTLADTHIKDPTGLVKQLATPAVATVVKNGYGQPQELDSDANAIRLMVAAGYDPNGLPEFLQKLESGGGGPFSTHPGKPQRISRARALIAQLGNPEGQRLEERFQASVNPQ